ncbi:hypothetical protein ACWEQC_06740 [Streptomyces shenzhenensis]
MARIQILELPTIYRENGDDETPFALVIDQADEATYQSLAFGTTVEADGTLRESLKDELGARAILTFEETIEIPANGVTVTDGQVVRLHVEGDFTKLRDQAEQEIHTVLARANTAAQSSR